jgi:hypothetical protein
MTEDTKTNSAETGLPDPEKIREPHLIDMGSVLEIAQWIAMFSLGLFADAIRDEIKDRLRAGMRETLANVKRRFGRNRIAEIETKVRDLVEDAKTRSDLGDEEIHARVEDIFKDLR